MILPFSQTTEKVLTPVVIEITGYTVAILHRSTTSVRDVAMRRQISLSYLTKVFIGVVGSRIAEASSVRVLSCVAFGNSFPPASTYKSTCNSFVVYAVGIIGK